MSKSIHKLAPLLILFLSACASVADRAVPPDVSVTGLHLREQSGLFQQRFALDLRIVNPNDFGFTLNGLAFTLYVNGERLATGVGDERVRIPALGEGVMTVEASSSLFGLIRQIRNLGQSDRLQYRIEGRAHVRGVRHPLPYEKEGEIAF